MTPYENQSLAAARDSVHAYWTGDAIAGLALFVTIVGGVIAYRNIKAVIWNSLLSFEQDMASRREKFAEIAIRMGAGEDTALLKLMFNESKESYFNSLDRLASSILNGHFSAREMRQDYRDVISDVVRQFPSDFDTGTRYRKVVKLYNRWQDR